MGVFKKNCSFLFVFIFVLETLLSPPLKQPHLNTFHLANRSHLESQLSYRFPQVAELGLQEMLELSRSGLTRIKNFQNTDRYLRDSEKVTIADIVANLNSDDLEFRLDAGHRIGLAIAEGVKRAHYLLYPALRSSNWEVAIGTIRGLAFLMIKDDEEAERILNVILDGDRRGEFSVGDTEKSASIEYKQREAIFALLHALVIGSSKAKPLLLKAFQSARGKENLLRALSVIAAREEPGGIEWIIEAIKGSQSPTYKGFLIFRDRYEHVKRDSKIEDMTSLHFSQVSDFVKKQREKFPFFENKSDLFVLAVSSFAYQGKTQQNLIERYYEATGHFRFFEKMAQIEHSYFVAVFLLAIKKNFPDLLKNIEVLDSFEETSARLHSFQVERGSSFAFDLSEYFLRESLLAYYAFLFRQEEYPILNALKKNGLDVGNIEKTPIWDPREELRELAEAIELFYPDRYIRENIIDKLRTDLSTESANRREAARSLGYLISQWPAAEVEIIEEFYKLLFDSLGSKDLEVVVGAIEGLRYHTEDHMSSRILSDLVSEYSSNLEARIILPSSKEFLKVAYPKNGRTTKAARESLIHALVHRNRQLKKRVGLSELLTDIPTVTLLLNLSDLSVEIFSPSSRITDLTAVSI